MARTVTAHQSETWPLERPARVRRADKHRALAGLRVRLVRRRRRRLATGLRGALDRPVERPSLSAALPVDRGAVRIARAALQELVQALESDEDVDARGVALTARLLTDACSPLYLQPGPGADPDALTNAARRALLALQPLGVEPSIEGSS